MTPITLYHCPRSRSSIALYLLEEIGIPYDIKITDARRRWSEGGFSRPQSDGQGAQAKDAG